MNHIAKLDKFRDELLFPILFQLYLAPICNITNITM